MFIRGISRGWLPTTYDVKRLAAGPVVRDKTICVPRTAAFAVEIDPFVGFFNPPEIGEISQKKNIFEINCGRRQISLWIGDSFGGI